jgi:exodeoxyribonuclease VII large subunit
MDEIFYSVDEITEEIASRLEGDPYLEDVWVVGEVSTVRSRGNHLFFNLVGESSRLPCVFFGRGWIKLEEGEVIQVYGSVRVYRQGGQYSFHVSTIERTGLRGLKSLKFFQIYEKLAKEGVLKKPKKILPEFPYRIGIITSTRSAAIMDILRTFKEKGYYFEIEIFHTGVQGEEAALEIKEAILRSMEKELDAVIIARGGGSKEDLWVFNDEEVIRAAASLPHYLITGIGHEIDTVLLDLVADERAHTPTAAAEVITSQQQRFFEDLKRSIERISEITENVIEATSDYLRRSMESISKSIEWKVELEKERLNASMKHIESLSPLKVLERGFAVVLKDGKVIKSVKNVKSKDILKVIMKDGEIKVVVR